MKALRFALPLFLLSLSAFGQYAKVVELKPEDAAKAKQLHDALKAAQKAVYRFNNAIASKYAPGHGWVGSPWATGFEFSEDFRFIVPQRSDYGTYIMKENGTPILQWSLCPSHSDWGAVCATYYDRDIKTERNIQ